jgi:hypothetical protein
LNAWAVGLPNDFNEYTSFTSSDKLLACVALALAAAINNENLQVQF